MRPFTLLPTLACLILIVAHRARGYSSGAPEESCDSLTVSHIHVGSPAPGAECDSTCRQARQLRWIGNSSANSFTYNCNETYQLQLTTTAPTDVSLNGYMVAPRKDTGTPLDGSIDYVGSWENGTDIKLLCNESAVTQSRALVATTTVNMTWKAPMYGLTNVAFWFVIVPSTAFYYLPVKSLTATPNPEACTCPPGQCQWQNGTVFSCVEPDNSLCVPGEVFNATECQCEVCSRVCQNGGTLDGGTCMCSCVGSFSGANCETMIVSPCNRMCQNGGTLAEASCTCDCADGFSGDNCETPRIPVLLIVIGCCLGCAVIVCLIIIAAIVLVCIFRGKRSKFDSNDGDKVQLKGLTAQNVDTQCLNPELSTSENVKLEQNPAYTDTELHKPTTEPPGKEDAVGETSDAVNFEGLTAQKVDMQYLNPQLSTSENVKLEQNPAYTDTELHKPTTEPPGKEDAVGETSDDLKL